MTTKHFFLVTVLGLMTSTCLTSCEELFGEWDKPTPSTVPASSTTYDAKSTPLTLEAVNGTMNVRISSGFTVGKTIEYSIDNGASWVSIAPYSGAPVTITCSKVLLRGNNATYAYYDGSVDYSTNIYCSDDCYVYGNVMSLINATNFATLTSFDETNGKYALHRLFQVNTKMKNHPDKELVLPAMTLSDGCYDEMFAGCDGMTRAPQLPALTMKFRCYSGMFFGCDGLTSAPELPSLNLAEECYQMMFSHCTALTASPVLAATNLARGCYSFMFSNCTAMTEGPELPSTNLAFDCYSYMFQECTSLSSTPELPATILTGFCYSHMFSGCTSLTASPVLPATVLQPYCYNEMFSDCSNLKSVICGATDISALHCTDDWLKGVSATGEFCGVTSTAWTLNSDSGIPTGWTPFNPLSTPLTLEAVSGTIIISVDGVSLGNPIEYSVDNGATWTSTTSTLFLECSKVLFRSHSQYSFCIQSHQDFYLYGNVMSLINETTYPTLTALDPVNDQNAFSSLFYRNGNHIKNHPVKDLVLPATTLAKGCYRGMFEECTGLTKAPELPATILADYCYEEMFKGCSNLTSVSCKATDISATDCLKDWLSGVAATGTVYTKPSSSMTGSDWPTNSNNGIPSGWTRDQSL